MANVIYFATNHATAVPIMQAAYRGEVAVRLGYIDTPNQGNRLPEDVLWCADNGCFSDKWEERKWLRFLEKNAHSADRCAFAVAPDVVGDAAATAEKSRPWIGRIKELGYKVAWVAQNGWDASVVPWDEIDAIFIGGDDDFKLGAGGAQAAADAHEHGKWLHVGRANSALRMDVAAALDADSADGSCLVKGAIRGGINVNLHEVLGWVGDAEAVEHAIDWVGLERVVVETRHGPEPGLRIQHQSEFELVA